MGKGGPDKRDMTLHMWIMGGLFTLFSGAALTNAYWLNRSVVELQKDVNLLKFKVFNVVSETPTVLPRTKVFIAYPSLFGPSLPTDTKARPRSE